MAQLGRLPCRPLPAPRELPQRDARAGRDAPLKAGCKRHRRLLGSGCPPRLPFLRQAPALTRAGPQLRRATGACQVGPEGEAENFRQLEYYPLFPLQFFLGLYLQVDKPLKNIIYTSKNLQPENISRRNAKTESISVRTLLYQVHLRLFIATVWTNRAKPENCK